MKPLDIYNILEKTNCAECGHPTCMAFATAVLGGECLLTGCPHIDMEAAGRLSKEIKPVPAGGGFTAPITEMKERLSKADFSSIAKRLGAALQGDSLTVNCLGKDFTVDRNGDVTSSCHIHIWIETIVLNYLLSDADGRLSGERVSFEGLRTGATSAPYFKRRCEDPLRAIADGHTEIFFELLEIFKGKAVDGFEADYAVEISPLPKVPFLITYWKGSDGFDSTLKVLFDRTADNYLKPEVISFMGRGIVEMLLKIIPRHEEYKKDLLYL